MKLASSIFACVALILSCAHSGYAQSSSSGTVQGTVVDPSGAIIKGATVEIRNPVSQFNRTAQTDTQGAFTFTNVPFSNYHVQTSAPGFQTAEQDVQVESGVPVQMKIGLTLGTQSTTVEVTGEGRDLVTNTPVTETNVDRSLFSKVPLESQSSELSSLVTLATPGVAADSNGLFHGLGDHASNSFSIDGQPVTDQQSKVFSNQLPLDAVQSMQVIEGAPPAQYGDKTSLVVVVNTRSGLGVTQPHADLTTSYGTFGTTNTAADLAYGGQTWGNFISLNGLDSRRFLDTPEFAVLHDRGNEENFFDRADYKPSDSDTFTVGVQYTRSWFQTPNSYDAQDATGWNGLVVDNGGLGPNGLPVGAQDQRSKIQTFNISPKWTHLVNPHLLFTVNAWVRRDGYNYYPSDNPFADFTPDLQSSTVGQTRSLLNAGGHIEMSYVHGVHNILAGIQYEDTLLNEKDSFALVDPTANPPCLNPDGSADTDPTVTNQSQCTGALSANPNYLPILATYDLTRPVAGTGLYTFAGHADIREFAQYIQDTISLKGWTFNLGIRGDEYNGITKAQQAEPRVGVAYNIKGTNTVLRASYARTMETPFNENLILASIGCNDQVVAAFQTFVAGANCVVNSPLSPGHRNEFHVGLQQAFGRWLVVNAEYIWKYTHKAFDFSVLANTPITYPIEWQSSKIPGYAISAVVPNIHGFTAYVNLSSVAARFFAPQVSGIGAVPGGVPGVFRIDHDELFNQNTHLQYQPWKRGPWFGFNWRYDSGLVAGPVPCAGGNCANGPAGSDTVVDASIITPDQQFEAGLYCGSVHATPTTPISPTSICPASMYGSTLLQIPAPGTENDDHNPPRVAGRNLFDVAIGDENLFNGDKYRWSARLTIINLTDKYALYNFLSTFSGTHYVSPRTFTGSIGFHF
ncbi:MAG TPA: TonB-dependent receptor [Bryobacteraceae bacterium]|nr:TonB-dependent receptor [Bryobacteraceae bacterium]